MDEPTVWWGDRCAVTTPARAPQNVSNPIPMAVTNFCACLQDTAATPVGILPPVCAAAYGPNQPTFNCYALQPEVINPSKVQSVVPPDPFPARPRFPLKFAPLPC